MDGQSMGKLCFAVVFFFLSCRNPCRLSFLLCFFQWISEPRVLGRSDESMPEDSVCRVACDHPCRPASRRGHAVVGVGVTPPR